MRLCELCEKQFHHHNPRTKGCSDECRAELRAQKARRRVMKRLKNPDNAKKVQEDRLISYAKRKQRRDEARAQGLVYDGRSQPKPAKQRIKGPSKRIIRERQAHLACPELWAKYGSRVSSVLTTEQAQWIA